MSSGQTINTSLSPSMASHRRHMATLPGADFSAPSTTRVKLHYSLMVVVLAIYGVQVCPFIESLTLWALLPPLMAVLALQYMLRARFVRKLGEQLVSAQQLRQLLMIEMGLALASGVILTAYNMLVHGFPVSSGLKLLLGFVILGFFAAIDLGLEWERAQILFARMGGRVERLHSAFMPLSRKLGLVFVVALLSVTGVMFLVINKDLEWLLNTNHAVSMSDSQQAILIELVFVMIVVLAYVLNIVFAFTRNLTLFFNHQNAVLVAASEGEFDTQVPLVSNDEFGVMGKYTNKMVRGLSEMTAELDRTRDVTILSLATLAETRDNETGSHLLRTQRYVRTLAQALVDHPRFCDYLDEETIDLLYKSAPLHDIGKVGIPDAILLKPGKHTDEEFTIMKTHAQMGADALAGSEQALGGNSFLTIAREIAISHHERWDGGGYPNGLKGESIPVSGRLMALADVYDALITKRVYKPAFSHDKAARIIREGSGYHFDPDVVAAFDRCEAVFIEIAHEHQDQPDELGY